MLEIEICAEFFILSEEELEALIHCTISKVKLAVSFAHIILLDLQVKSDNKDISLINLYALKCLLCIISRWHILLKKYYFLIKM